MNVRLAWRPLRAARTSSAAFLEHLRRGFENPEGLTGTVRLSVDDRPGETLMMRVGSTLTVKSGHADKAVDAEIRAPESTLRTLVEEAEGVDLRDPALMSTIGVSGEEALAAHVLKICLRPSPETTTRYATLEGQHAQAGHRALKGVERRHSPTQLEVLEAMAAGLPLVIGGLNSSKWGGHWSLERLAARFPHAPLRVRSRDQRQTFEEFIAAIKAFDPERDAEDFTTLYTDGVTLPEEMHEHFCPPLFDGRSFGFPQLWLGVVPVTKPATVLHRDPRCGFLMQLIGRKRLTLYSSDQAKHLYPAKAYNHYQHCWFQPHSPDFTRYPHARNARPLTVTLSPGELLIQPAGWFHQVHALDSPNMSVSHFWRYQE